MERHRTSAALLAGDCAARGGRVRALRSHATGVGVPFCRRRSPRLARARPADAARCSVFGPVQRDTGQRHPTRRPGRGYAARRSTPARASRVDCASSEVTAIPRRGSGGFPRRVDAGTEFGPNLVRISPREIDRRSREIAGDRMRSTESRPTSPILAQIVRPPGFST